MAEIQGQNAARCAGRRIRYGAPPERRSALKRHIMDMGITKGVRVYVAQGGAAWRSHRGDGPRLRAVAAQRRGGVHLVDARCAGIASRRIGNRRTMAQVRRFTETSSQELTQSGF